MTLPAFLAFALHTRLSLARHALVSSVGALVGVSMAGHELQADEQQADQKRLLLERFQAEVGMLRFSQLSLVMCVPSLLWLHASMSAEGFSAAMAQQPQWPPTFPPFLLPAAPGLRLFISRIHWRLCARPSHIHA